MVESIWDIIARIVQNEDVSSQERSYFKEWYNASSDNKKIYNRMSGAINQLSSDKPSYKIDSDKAFYRNQLIIKNVSKKRIRNIYSYIAYAASVVLVFSAIFFFIYDFKDNKQVAIVTSSPIQVGYKKAILQLEDGREVKLDAISSNKIIKQEEGAVVSNDNATLKYSAHKAKAFKLRYNKLVIPRGGEYQLVLSDGTKVWLNSETSLEFPVAFGGGERIVFLEGEAYFEVKKDASRPFVVKSQNVKTRVLGTSFNVSSYGNTVYTTLVEGSVVIEDYFKKRLRLIPGEQSVYNVSSHSVVKKKVSVDLFTSWKDGSYKFENERLENIMSTISRWYNIHVFYANAAVKEMRFTGKIMRYKNISDFVNMLEMTHDIRFEINNNSVVVSKKIKSYR